MEYSFNFQGQGKETGMNWAGKFKYVRPTLGDRSRLSALRGRLNGDKDPDDLEVAEFNHAIAYLRHTLKEYPDWWAETTFGLEMYDGNVVSEIYNKVMDFEVEWKKKIHGGDESDVSDEDKTKKLVRDIEKSIT